MGETLRIKILGPLEVHVGAEPVTIGEHKAAELLVWLLLNRGKNLERKPIAKMLWRGSEEKALLNLRQAVHKLRLAVEPRRKKWSYIVEGTTRNHIRFNTDSDYWLDVEEFERCIREAGALKPGSKLQIELLERAEQYFNLDEYVVYQAWGISQAIAELRRHYAKVVERLIEHYQRNRDTTKVLEYCNRARRFNVIVAKVNQIIAEWEIQSEEIRLEEKFESLLKKAEHTRRSSSYNAALELTMKAESIARQIADERRWLRLYEIHVLKSKIYQHKGDYEMLRREATRAQKLANTHGDRIRTGIAQKYVADVFLASGERDMAYNELCEAKRKVRGSNEGMARVYLALGNWYRQYRRNDGEYRKAMACWQQAKEYAQRIEDQELRKELFVNAVVNLGSGHFDLRELEKAEDHATEALILANAHGIKMAQAFASNNLASIYVDRRRFDSALRFFEAARLLFEEIGTERHTLLALGNKGVCYLNMGYYDEAKHCFDEVLENPHLESFLRCEILINMGNVLREQGFYSDALDYYEKAYRSKGCAARATDIHLKMGIVLLEEGNHTRAIGLLTKVLEEAADVKGRAERQELVARAKSFLARGFMIQGKQKKARQFSDSAILLLESLGDKCERPQELYWNHYLILARGNKLASKILQKAYRLVKNEAYRIEDLDMRKNFLQKVRVNREILKAFAASTKRVIERI